MVKHKLPEDAKKVFTGIIFDVYHWEQEMFDGSYRTFEAVKALPSVQILAITPDKKIVLLREKQPYSGSFLSLPGGRVERGEGFEEAAKREFIQETGLEYESLNLWKETSMESKIIYPTFYYIAKGCENSEIDKIDLPGEDIEIFYATFEEFLNLIESENFRNRHFADMIFRMKHTNGQLEKFKSLLFE
jgi:8-oxo-dGTP pyrophosphatase MutT (NUDIX family)